MIKKILLAVTLLTAVIVGGTGCMRINQSTVNNSTPNANELALAYMEEKYGESFTFLSPWGNSMSGTREILVTCDSLPGQQILVQVENFKTDNAIYRDNYLAVKYQEEIIDLFKNTAANTFGAVNVFYTPSKQCVSADSSADTTFETFYADTSTVIGVMIEIRGSRFTNAQDVQNYLNSFTNTQGEIAISVVVVDDEIFGTLDRRGLNDLVYNEEAIYSAFGKIVDGSLLFDETTED